MSLNRPDKHSEGQNHEVVSPAGHILSPDFQCSSSFYTSDLIQEGITGSLQNIVSSLRKNMSRRDFLKSLAVATGVVAGFPGSYEGRDQAALTEAKEANEDSINIETLYEQAGYEKSTWKSYQGEEKQVWSPIDNNLEAILSDEDSEVGHDLTLTMSYVEDKYKEPMANMIQETHPELSHEEQQDLVNRRLVDIAGSAIAFWGVKNIFEKGGLTKKDYMRIIGFTGFAYAVGNHERREHLVENLKETADAVLNIGTLTEVSDFVLFGKRRIIEDFFKFTGHIGLEEEEMRQYVEHLNVEERARLERRLLAFEGETLQQFYNDLRQEGERDIAQILQDFDFNGNGSEHSEDGSAKNHDIHFEGQSIAANRVDKFRLLLLTSNALGAVTNTLLSSSLLSPLAREIARTGTGQYDEGMMSALQGFIPNNLGVWAPPAMYKPLSKLFHSIPILNKAVIGADFGPRLAITQIATEGHGIELLSTLDSENWQTLIGMNANYVAEMAHNIARIEDRSFTSVLGELVNPQKLRATYQYTKTLEGRLNIEDAVIGRSDRALGIVRRVLVGQDIMSHEETEALHQEHAAKVTESEQTFNTLGDKITDIFGGSQRFSSLSSALSSNAGKINQLFNSHSWEHAIGEELTDIFKTLPFQSASVPFIEGAGAFLLELGASAIPEDIGHKTKDQIIDATRFAIYGGMSTVFDNFAAVKAGVGTAIAVVKENVAKGEYANEDELGKALMAKIKKVYDSGIIGGGGLPPGNMPNLKMFPYSVYSMASAMKRLPVRSIPALLALGYDTFKDLSGSFNTINPTHIKALSAEVDSH